jgi:hypothetical protein
LLKPKIKKVAAKTGRAVRKITKVRKPDYFEIMSIGT